MKYLYLILSIFLFNFTIAQNTFNKTLFNPPENICEGFNTLDGANGGSSIIEMNNSYTVVGGGGAPEFCGLSAIRIWKIDTKGEIISERVYGSDTLQYFAGYRGNNIESLGEGVFIAGSVNNINSGLSDILLMKFDNEENVVFEKTYGGELYDIGYTGKQLADGGFLITGSTRSFGTATETNSDIFLLRTDAEGNELWQKNFGGSKDDIAQSLDIAEDGGFLIGGKKGVGGLADQKRTYVIKTDSIGNYEWSKLYDERLWFGCSAVLRSTQDGGFVMTSCTYVEEYNRHNLGLDYEMNYIAKANHWGNIVWQYFPSTEHSIFISTLREMEDGSIIGAGTWSWGKSTIPLGYIIKLSAEGDFIWERIIYYDAFGFNRFRDFQQTEDGGLILTGTAWNPERWHQDLWLVKVDENGCLSEEVCDSLTTNIEVLNPSEITPPKLFPNPTKSLLQIQIPNYLTSKPLQIKLTNIEGRVVKKMEVVDGQQLEVSDLGAGIYIATWFGEGQVLKREKVVVVE